MKSTHLSPSSPNSIIIQKKGCLHVPLKRYIDISLFYSKRIYQMAYHLSKNKLSLLNYLMPQIMSKIHNNQRMRKRESEKRAAQYITTPPKRDYKHSFFYRYRKIQEKMGYDYQQEGNKTLKWMKQEFQDKMTRYLGNSKFVKKQTRMDKVRLKEQLNFEVQVNPLVTIFSRINRNIEKRMLLCAFTALC